MGLQFTPTVSVSDVVTSVTVALSAIALVTALRQDRRQRLRESADQVRTAAADTLARFDRYARAPEDFVSDIQPLLVEASEMLAKTHDVLQVRDFLWKEINAIWRRMRERQHGESIELSQARLFAHRPDIYEDVRSAREQFDQELDHALGEILTSSQASILKYDDKLADYTPAALGNDLRLDGVTFYLEVTRRLSPLTAGIRAKLQFVVAQDDRTVLRRETLPVRSIRQPNEVREALIDDYFRDRARRRPPSDSAAAVD